MAGVKSNPQDMIKEIASRRVLMFSTGKRDRVRIYSAERHGIALIIEDEREGIVACYLVFGLDSRGDLVLEQ